MKLHITAWQRFQSLQAVGALRGNVAILRQGAHLMDILEFTDKEKAEIGYVERPGGGASWRAVDRLFDLEIKDKNQSDLLKRALEQVQDWPVGNAGPALDLLDQVGVKFPDEAEEEE